MSTERPVTLDIARQALPEVRELVTELRDAWETHEVLRYKVLTVANGRPFDDLLPSEQDRVNEHLPPMQRLMERISACRTRLKEIGCVVRGIREGIVEFYALVDHQPVWLCWRLDEEDIAYYHALEDSCAARQPIDRR